MFRNTSDHLLSVSYARRTAKMVGKAQPGDLRYLHAQKVVVLCKTHRENEALYRRTPVMTGPATEYPPEAEVRRLRIIVPILERMHPATLRWLAARLGLSGGAR